MTRAEVRRNAIIGVLGYFVIGAVAFIANRNGWSTEMGSTLGIYLNLAAFAFGVMLLLGVLMPIGMTTVGKILFFGDTHRQNDAGFRLMKNWFEITDWKERR